MTTFGLETNDANGNPLLRTNDTVGRIFGTASTGKTNGSLTVSGGDALWAFTPTFYYNYGYPTVTSDGSTISWTYADPNSNFNLDIPFVYGSKGGAPGASGGNDFGLTVTNDQGKVQVESSYSNLGLIASGVVTMTQDPVAHPQRMVIADVTVNGASPWLAFATSARPVA